MEQQGWSPWVTEARQRKVQEMLARRVGSVVAVAEGVRRRHNISAILRSAECFGVHEVHLVTAGFRPSAGAARGAERWVDVHTSPTVEGALTALKARGFRVLVADLTPDAYAPEEVPLDRPVAVVLGTEVAGVSDAAKALADGAVMIPMVGLTESLNVSVSAAILLRTLADRVRRARGPDLSPDAQRAFYDRWLAEEERAFAGFKARCE